MRQELLDTDALLLCVNMLNTPGYCSASVSLTKDLKVLGGDLVWANLSSLFTIYAWTYQLPLPLYEKYPGCHI